jgi:hypothetical protein
MSNLTENQLAALLKNSRAIINKVEDNNFQRGNIDPSMLAVEGDLVETPMAANREMKINESNVRQVTSNQKYRNIGKTKLPKEIVEAMVNDPIEIPETPFHTFDVSDSLVKEVNSIDENYDYEEKIIPNKLSQSLKKSVGTTTTKKQTINESTNDVRQMIREELTKILPKVISEYFDQRVISEQIQVKVGNTLFSGNLKPLPSKTK